MFCLSENEQGLLMFGTSLNSAQRLKVRQVRCEDEGRNLECNSSSCAFTKFFVRKLHIDGETTRPCISVCYIVDFLSYFIF